MNFWHADAHDLIQYALIAALFFAAFADRSAHRAYTKVMSAMYRDLVKSLARIDAKLDRKDPP